MPSRFAAKIVGTGLKALGGAVSGAGSLVLRFAEKPERSRVVPGSTEPETPATRDETTRP